jgi:uncharacterized protein with PQ loop repeat
MDTEQVSYILGIISLAFYSIVYLPQFILIYRTKSAEGISLWMLLLWTQADILSLIGTILLYLPSSFIIIGWYHYVVGLCMITFVLYYKGLKPALKDDTTLRNKYRFECLAAFVFFMINTIICISLNVLIKEQYYEIGSAIGWITMSLYLIGRFPQIMLNIKRKTTDGLSIVMYIFTMCGNGFYIGVILCNLELLNENMPWLITGIVTILLDIFVLCQDRYYKGKKEIVLP